MPTRIGSVDALKRRGNDRFDPEQVRAFCSPIPRRTGAVLAARQDNLWSVNLCGIVHRHHLVRFVVESVAALGTGGHLVANTNVCEGATHHDFVVATTATKRIEIALLDVALDQPLACGAIGRERTGRRNVIGRDGVAQFEQDLGILD